MLEFVDGKLVCAPQMTIYPSALPLASTEAANIYNHHGDSINAASH